MVSHSQSDKHLLQLSSKDGRILQVAFNRSSDRFGHAIRVSHEGDSYVELRSMEGGESERWPASPPLQDLLIQEVHPGVMAAMLVGMAGTSHWSASVEADELKGELRFDIACRVKEAPAWLGSSYAATAPRPTHAESSSALRFGDLLITVDDDSAPSQLVADDDDASFTIRPLRQAEADIHTWRWKYNISLVELTRK